MFVFFIADTQTADKISLRVVLTCISLMAGEDRPFFHDFKKKKTLPFVILSTTCSFG